MEASSLVSEAMDPEQSSTSRDKGQDNTNVAAPVTPTENNQDVDSEPINGMEKKKDGHQ